MISYEIRSVKDDELGACLSTLHSAFGESAKNTAILRRRIRQAAHI
jgi:hypothetical protein